jgi:hypothetical protein
MWNSHAYSDLEDMFLEGDIPQIETPNTNMEEELLKNIFPDQEPDTLPTDVLAQIEASRSTRLNAINGVITKHTFWKCCEKEKCRQIIDM